MKKKIKIIILDNNLNIIKKEKRWTFKIHLFIYPYSLLYLFAIPFIASNPSIGIANIIVLWYKYHMECVIWLIFQEGT